MICSSSWSVTERADGVGSGGLELRDALAVAENPSSALRSVIRAICETEHWSCGRFFGVDEAAAVLRCVETWGRDDPAVEAFIARSRSKLYQRGDCHTVEVYDGEVLIGGLYGVSLGRAFFGESMFHRARDASKIALVHLVARLKAGGYRLSDIDLS